MATTTPFNATLLKVLVGTKPIAFQRDATLNLSRDLIDTTSKDNNGWKSNIPGLKDWSLDTNFELQYSSDGSTSAIYSDLMDAFLNGTTLTLSLSTGLTGDIKLSGPAIITKMDVGAPMEDVATCDITFNTAGPLTKAYNP